MSNQSCKGWQCLTRLPQDPYKAGWRYGYCPECLDELARDEIREERQATRNESDTPETDAHWAPIDGSAFASGHAGRKLMEKLERERDEARMERDALQTVAGELIAMIRVNVMRDTFREATIEQVDAHLRPWAKRIASVKADENATAQTPPDSGAKDHE
jgi:hypothetical protein